jgi:hypothetical protein
MILIEFMPKIPAKMLAPPARGAVLVACFATVSRVRDCYP